MRFTREEFEIITAGLIVFVIMFVLYLAASWWMQTMGFACYINGKYVTQVSSLQGCKFVALVKGI